MLSIKHAHSFNYFRSASPQLRKVKTRLAAALSASTALTIYKELVGHTLKITKAVAAGKFVFYTGEIVEDDIRSKENYFKHQQARGDLGEKMLDAFTNVLQNGYDKVCIIGSDCLELTTEHIEDAFAALKNKDIVIGPAYDGGYYLIGMKRLYPSLFTNKNWSTATVFIDTIQTISDLGLTVTALPVLHDIDEVKDVPEEWLVRLKNQAP